MFRRNRLQQAIKYGMIVANTAPGDESQINDIASLLTDEPIGGSASDAKDENIEKDEEQETPDLQNEKLDSEESEESSEQETEEEQSEEESGSEEESDESWESVLGLSEDNLEFDENGNIAGVKVKVNGESATVGMSDLLAGYQINKSNTLKSQELSEEKKVFEQQVTEVTKDYQTRLENVDLMANYLNDQLMSEFKAVDWEQLRVENPAEYAAARQDFSMRSQQLQDAQQAIQSERQQAQQQTLQKQAESQKAYLQEQYNIVIKNNPTWVDSKVYKTEMDKMKSFLGETYGFADQDFSVVRDARLFELVKDAMKLHSGKEVVEKKIQKPVPKFQKSKGTANKKATNKLARLTKKAKEATGANKRVVQTDAIAELLMGNS